ncbi:MAG: glycosyltransferase [Chthoniobacterales bacterium]
MTSVLSEPIRVRAKFFFEGDKKFFLKGVTYGPFAPDEKGEYFGKPERAKKDMAMIRESGINVVRIYYVPPDWFLDTCAEAGLRVMVSVPWPQNIAFLQDRKVRREVINNFRQAVRKHKGHPAIFGYFAGNEIDTTMVRWLGARRVIEFIELLINVGKSENPDALFSYASFPPTEYLLPQNIDFLALNVYLHRQDDFERYLARLQNLAEDKPLVLGEFGMDTIRHPQEEQAEFLRWQIQSGVLAGLAGMIVYSWTDEWYRGGQEILDWAFGMTTREREPKKSFGVVSDIFAGEKHITMRVPLEEYPKVSVIVCSYNGAKTLGDCLDSLKKLRYPNYEVVLVDDGSKDNTPEIAARHPWINYIKQENKGLSVARNVGAYASTGEIVAYTDSDCMADPDWLYYLVHTLLSGDYAGVGGPNISPPAEDWIQACVAAAPGGPSHVLLTDVVAEHIPGCNMAFHRWAFDLVGGFDAEYRKAGDDVDFCWRLQQEGGVIAFSPAAIVWHYRRFTLQAFRKQQEGYGEAESMLRFKHLVFFGPTGTAKWRGQIYGAPRFTWLVNRPVIYHGIFGNGLFQSIYPTPQSDVAAYLSSVEWVVLTMFIFVISIPLPALRIVPFLMFAGTFTVALSYMIHAKLEPRFDTIRARLLVTALAFTQPLVRGWTRYFTWLKYKRTPRDVFAKVEADLAEFELPKRRGAASELLFWGDYSINRDNLIHEVVSLLDKEGWSYSIDTGWQDWDVQVYGNFWWGVRMLSVTEIHRDGCLTRVRVKNKLVATTVLLNAILLGVLAYQAWLNPQSMSFMILVGLYALFVAYLAVRARRLKRRFTQLVDAAAMKCGFKAILKKAVPKQQEG